MLGLVAVSPGYPMQCLCPGTKTIGWGKTYIWFGRMVQGLLAVPNQASNALLVDWALEKHFLLISCNTVVYVSSRRDFDIELRWCLLAVLLQQASTHRARQQQRLTGAGGEHLPAFSFRFLPSYLTRIFIVINLHLLSSGFFRSFPVRKILIFTSNSKLQLFELIFDIILFFLHILHKCLNVISIISYIDSDLMCARYQCFLQTFFDLDTELSYRCFPGFRR
jgi:hypothetical protein